jgi:hypothetical protein
MANAIAMRMMARRSICFQPRAKRVTRLSDERHPKEGHCRPAALAPAREVPETGAVSPGRPGDRHRQVERALVVGYCPNGQGATELPVMRQQQSRMHAN